MNLTKRISILAIFSAFAATAMAQSASTTTSDTPQTPPPPHHMMKHHGGMMMHDRPFLMVVHQLNLTADQHKQIRDIIEKSEAQAKADRMNHKEAFAGLMNPGDPNYASAVQAAKDAAVARIDQMSQDNTAIYNLLTADQKAKLPQVLDSMKQRMKEHMQDHHDHQQQGSADHTH